MGRNSKARRRTPTTSPGRERRVCGGARWLSSCRRSSRTWGRESGLVPCGQTANPARPLVQTLRCSSDVHDAEEARLHLSAKVVLRHVLDGARKVAGGTTKKSTETRSAR